MIGIRVCRRLTLSLVMACAVLVLASSVSIAKPVSIAQVKAVVRSWMFSSASTFGNDSNRRIAKVSKRQLTSGVTLYYIVDMSPTGCVIVSSDDLIEPVIAFLPDGYTTITKDNPLIAWLDADMQGRHKALFDGKNIYKPLASRVSGHAARNQSRWKQFTSNVSAWSDTAADVRVAPLVSTQWGQSEIGNGEYCYNYYTPRHYPSGCVATSLAQLIRYHSWPEEGIGTRESRIVVDSVSQMATTLGGDGNGGAYSYSTMPTSPSSDRFVSTDQLRAIGALCYDAGVACETQYNPNGSAATFASARRALLDTFKYENSIVFINSGKDITPNIPKICDSNLDAGLPVIFAIESPTSAHAVVCDGYGYNDSVIYHHLNFGWSGVCNAWYNLPETTSPYKSVFMAIYNIFPKGTGEVVSGRVVDGEGRPISDTEVSITTTVSGKQITLKTTTDIRGIYGIKNVPSNRDVTVVANKPGYSFNSVDVSVGSSRDNSAVCGNVSGVDITGQLLVADMIGPSCTVSTTTNHTNNAPLTFHVAFSEPVLDFSSESMVVTNGQITDISGDWSNYTVVVEPKADGYVQCNVKGMSCTDFSGNGNRLSNYAVILYDSTNPGVIISRAEGQQDPAESLPIKFRAVFSEAVLGFTSSDVVFSGTARGVPKISVQGGPKEYLILVNGLVSKGTVGVEIEVNSVTDAIGNPNTSVSETATPVTYAPNTPAINILFPTPEPSCIRNVPDLVLSGTSVGFEGDMEWSWSLDSGATGTCYGNTDWESSPIWLEEGENKLIVSATDTAGNSYSTELKATYKECVPGDAWSGLALVSLPIEPDYADPKISTGFLNYWSAFIPQEQRYSPYASSDRYEWFRIPAQTPGRGFWAMFDTKPSVVPSGNIPDQASNRVIRLYPGWNLIGSPFAAPVEWGIERIMVRTPGGVAQTLSKRTDLANCWLWGWRPDADLPNRGSYYLVTEYSLDCNLEPWKGYWIKARQECELIIPAP